MIIETESASGQVLTPVLALVFMRDTQGRVYPYKAPVEQAAGGSLMLGATVQGTAEDLTALRGCLEDGGVNLHHEHVLYHGRGRVVWWVPAGPRKMHFDSRSHGASSIDALSGRTFPQPPLLMSFQGQQLQVFALREDRRPTLDTPLFKAPYWNMFETAVMCTGSVRLPREVDPQHPEVVTALFFASNFSGASRTNLTEYGRSHQELWEEAARRGNFDPAWLTPESSKRTTVRQVLL